MIEELTNPNKMNEQMQSPTPQLNRHLCFGTTPGTDVKSQNTKVSSPETMTEEAFCDLHKLITLKKERNESASLTSISTFDDVHYERIRSRVLTYFSLDRDINREKQLSYSIDYYFKEAMLACFYNEISQLIATDCAEKALRQFITKALEETENKFFESHINKTDERRQFKEEFTEIKATDTLLAHLRSIQKDEKWLHKKIKEQRDIIIANATDEQKYCELIRWYNEIKESANNCNVTRRGPSEQLLLRLINNANQSSWLLDVYNTKEKKSVEKISGTELKQWLEKISDDSKYTPENIRKANEVINQQARSNIYNDIFNTQNNTHEPAQTSADEVLLFEINAKLFTHLKETAQHEYDQATSDLQHAEKAMNDYRSSLRTTQEAVFEQSSTRKNSKNTSNPSSNENIIITELQNQKTLLNLGLELADTTIIAAQLKYAEHSNKDATGAFDSTNKNKLNFIRKTLKNIVSDDGKILDAPAFLYLINSGCFTSEFIEQLNSAVQEDCTSSSLPTTPFIPSAPSTPFTPNIHSTPSFSASNIHHSPLLFELNFSSQKYSLNPEFISYSLEKASVPILVDLIEESKENLDQLVLKEIKRRYKISADSSSEINIPCSILQALEKKAAITKRFEYLTNLFAKALSYVCKNYQKDSEHYHHKLNVILDKIQKSPDINTSNDLLAQAEKIANEILNDNNSDDSDYNDKKKEPNVRQYRDKSPCHILASKTVRLINDAVNPSCSLTGLFSTKNGKIHPLTNEMRIHSDQANQQISIEKSMLISLIDKAGRSEEAQRRAVLAAHVFENTLRYLNKRSKSIWEKISDSFSSQSTPQQLLNDSENNDPKYKALMEHINQFIHNEDQNAAAQLFDQLDNEQSDVHKTLYGKNWSLITFKSQSSRELEKDLRKKELLTQKRVMTV